jgi:hypothetical protein
MISRLAVTGRDDQDSVPLPSEGKFAVSLAQGTGELIASYVEAVGTISAVVVALFIQFYLVEKRRPALVVTLDESLEDRDLAVVDGHSKIVRAAELNESGEKLEYHEFYLRIKVWALPKRRSATGVQAAIVQGRRTNGGDTRLAGPEGLLKWSGPTYNESVNIAPGTSQRVDVLRYGQIGPDESPVLIPVINRPGHTTHFPPNPTSRYSESGTYRIEIVVSCNDAEPVFSELAFNLIVPQDNPRVDDARELMNRVTLIDFRSIPAVSPFKNRAKRQSTAMGRRHWST